MHIAQSELASLPAFEVRAQLSRPVDRSTLLRVMSLIHRRGFPVVELHADDLDAGTREPVFATVCVVLRGTERHVGVLSAGLGSMVGVVDVHTAPLHSTALDPQQTPLTEGTVRVRRSPLAPAI